MHFLFHRNYDCNTYTHFKVLEDSRINSIMFWCVEPSILTPFTDNMMSPIKEIGIKIHYKELTIKKHIQAQKK